MKFIGQWDACNIFSKCCDKWHNIEDFYLINNSVVSNAVSNALSFWLLYVSGFFVEVVGLGGMGWSGELFLQYFLPARLFYSVFHHWKTSVNKINILKYIHG